MQNQTFRSTDRAGLCNREFVCPHAMAVVTADSPQRALHLYDRGADYVFIPRLHSAAQIAQVIETAMREGLQNAREKQINHLSTRDEVLA